MAPVSFHLSIKKSHMILVPKTVMAVVRDFAVVRAIHGAPTRLTTKEKCWNGTTAVEQSDVGT